MSKRTLRRSTERAARKSERNNQNAELTVTAAVGNVLVDMPPSNPMPIPPSEARLTANRLNAQKSTGPLTPQGRTTSARNALKHGLTGNTILLDTDDAVDYQTRLDYYTNLYKPAGFEERRLVQAIHDANWRLDRVLNLESTIYAKGRIELEDTFEELPLSQRKSFIELETSKRYAKDLRNLHIQESRLQRQRTKDLAALKQIQLERAKADAIAAMVAAATAKKSTTPQPAGFVFATTELSLPTPEFSPGQPVHPSLAAA